MEFEKFYGTIWKTGTSLVVTVPSNIMKFGGFKDRDEVVIMLRKKKKTINKEEK